MSELLNGYRSEYVCYEGSFHDSFTTFKVKIECFWGFIDRAHLNNLSTIFILQPVIRSRNTTPVTFRTLAAPLHFLPTDRGFIGVTDVPRITDTVPKGRYVLRVHVIDETLIDSPDELTGSVCTATAGILEVV